jgi:hypothetical protein
MFVREGNMEFVDSERLMGTIQAKRETRPAASNTGIV